jgi:hypothetical protein
MTQLVVFLLVIPFSVTLAPQPWWEILLDIFIILMVYDFFYYLVHRFLFHDGPLGAPLKWVHAAHHQMKNPCRKDSAYLHPFKTCLGIALYAATIGVLAIIMGEFHIVSTSVTFVAFSAINQHNHDLMEVDRFPFRFLKYMSDMHHVHHAGLSEVTSLPFHSFTTGCSVLTILASVVTSTGTKTLELQRRDSPGRVSPGRVSPGPVSPGPVNSGPAAWRFAVPAPEAATEST